MKARILLLLVVFISALYAQNTVDADTRINKADRLFFIENKGQWHSDVLYLCRMGGLDAWITKYGMNYTFYKIEKTHSFSSEARSLSSELYRNDHPKDKFNYNELENTTLLGHRVLFELQNHNPSPVREGKMQMEGYYNYFIGNDPTKYATYVGLYKEAVIKNVYNGIDLRYYFDKGGLRYDFIVQPYADAAQIQFKLRGQDKVYTKGEHKLCFTTRFGEVELADLKTYQENKVVPSRFVKQGETWTFALGEYDRSKPLVIDPLIYSTYIGGSGNDEGWGIAVDGSGNAYITGWTASTDYDVTAGVFQTTYGGGTYDVFVTKLNSTGSGLVYSTYIGGSNYDGGYGIAVDGSGAAYVTGETRSTDYDVTAGAFQTMYGGGGWADVFVTKLNATGTALVYSTYIGGSSSDYGNSIAVDGSGNAYVTGQAGVGYDVTPGAFQTTHGGSWDAFVTKVNATGTALVYSTYLGGSSNDYGYGIVIDGSGQAYITGSTNSTNYDITPGAFQITYGGGSRDVFVTKVNVTGTALVYSTYLGGSDWDEGYSIAVDGSGNAYITGYTISTNYDVTAGAFQTMHGGGGYDAFVTKVNATGTALVYSTYLGKSSTEEGRSIALNSSGQAYITGYTQSVDYYTTPGAFQTTYGGMYEIFVTQINSTGTALLYSTFIGGSNWDRPFGIAIDGSGNAYITGHTRSTDYDVTPGAFQTTKSTTSTSEYDVFVTKLCTDDTDPACGPPLPIKEMKLVGKLEKNSIQLIWQSTIQELIQHFVIEKWQNNTWQNIGKVSSNTYQYEDREGIYAGATLMYRIRAVNKDGQSYYSNVETIIVPEQNQSFSLYPNPAQNNVVIENFTTTAQEYELTDITGRILQTYTLPQGKNTIEINLPRGMYFVRERKQGKTEKLIIE